MRPTPHTRHAHARAHAHAHARARAYAHAQVSTFAQRRRLFDRLPAHDAYRPRAAQHPHRALGAHGHVPARYQQGRARLVEADGARLLLVLVLLAPLARLTQEAFRVRRRRRRAHRNVLARRAHRPRGRPDGRARGALVGRAAARGGRAQRVLSSETAPAQGEGSG